MVAADVDARLGTTDNRPQLRLGGNLRSDSIPANGPVDGRRGQCRRPAKMWRTATSTATARRRYERMDGRWGGRQCCICQVVGDGQVVRQPCWVATNVRRPCGRTDEFYHYADGSPTVRSVRRGGKQAVGWPKTDSSSLVRSENYCGQKRTIDWTDSRTLRCVPQN